MKGTDSCLGTCKGEVRRWRKKRGAKEMAEPGASPGLHGRAAVDEAVERNK